MRADTTFILALVFSLPASGWLCYQYRRLPPRRGAGQAPAAGLAALPVPAWLSSSSSSSKPQGAAAATGACGRGWWRASSSSPSSSSSEPCGAVAVTWEHVAVSVSTRANKEHARRAGLRWPASNGPLPTLLFPLNPVQTCDGKLAATGSNERQRQRHYILEQALGGNFATLAAMSAAATARTGRLIAMAAGRGE